MFATSRQAVLEPDGAERAARWTVATAGLAFFLLYTALALYRYQTFRTLAFDLGIFDQGTWLLSRFRDPFVTVRGLNLFADHTSGILFLVAPLYWIWSDVRLLIVLTGAALAAGAPLTYLAGRAVGLAPRWAAGAAVLYVLQPSIGWQAWDGFHPEVLAIPLLLWAFVAMMRDRNGWALLAIVLVLLTKEDAGLVVAPLGLLMALRWKKRIGWVIAGAGVVAFVVAFGVVLPALSPSGSLLYTDRYASIGTGPFGIVTGILTRPWVLFEGFHTMSQVAYLGMLLLPLPIVLFAPWTLLTVAPALFANLLSAHYYQYDIRYHYTAFLIPLLTIGAVTGLARLTRWRRQVAKQVMTGCVVAAVLGQVLFSPFPLGPRRANWPRPPANVSAHEDAVRLIPDDAVVAASSLLVSHLSQRPEIYLFPTPFRRHNYGLQGDVMPDSDRVEWVIASVVLPAAQQEVLDTLLASPEFEVAFTSDEVVVLHRRPD
ncbi:MAG: DUF2079 domain-containing protein [Acidimicrobiia bacterium]|jgi:uncharacterized membrane protein